MIYTIEEIRKQLARTAGSPIEAVKAEALLAIAERLEALVEAQKPRLVEFEKFEFPDYSNNGDRKCGINPSAVLTVSSRQYNISPGVYGEYVGIVTSDNDISSDEHWAVKGTLAEIMAKLRGDK